MNNYHYIVAGLPELSREWTADGFSADAIIGDIKEQCSAKDVRAIEFLEKGYLEENLTEDFYKEALAHKNGFLREWFRFDLNVRNAKVNYLNKALGRDSGRDVLALDGGDFEESAALDNILRNKDILSREKGIDDLTWAKAEELTLFHYFDIYVVLGFIVRLKIIDRWLKLDENTGREMFRKLVDEVRGTFKGINENNL